MAKAKKIESVKHNNFAANRIKRLNRQLKKHPNDVQAREALAANKTVSTRKPPIAKLGFVTSKTSPEVEKYIRSKTISSVTKDHAHRLVRILKLSKNAAYHSLATLVPDGQSLKIVFRNLSKKSNFKKPLEASTEVAA